MHQIKKLGKEGLRKYLGLKLIDMSQEVAKNGIIFESQFEKLGSSICKANYLALADLLKEQTNLDITYGYDKTTNHFYFYDESKYSYEEAFEESVKYQTDKANMWE